MRPGRPHPKVAPLLAGLLAALGSVLAPGGAGAESLALVLREGALVHGDLAHTGARVFKATRGDLPAVAPFDDLRAVAGRGPFVHGAARPLPCPAAAVPTGRGGLDAAGEALAEGRRGDALAAVERGAAAVACAPVPADPEGVARLKEAARGASPGQAEGGVAVVEVFPPEGARDLWIDGVAQPDPGRGRISGEPGIYVVQYRTVGGIAGIAVRVEAGRAVIADPEVALAAARRRSADQPAWGAGVALLQAAARRFVASTIYLAAPGKKGAVWSFDPDTGEIRQIARGRAPP
ncbi:hypothetical protein L6R50_06610 [Myxococcota bacterium]|nr:hypothetical protein [Myxococcota bacterium]